MTPESFLKLTEAQVWDVYLRPRDKSGRLIRMRDGRRVMGWREKRKRMMDRVMKTSPPLAGTLNIPDEAWVISDSRYPPVRKDYVRLFWQVNLSRGISQEEILERFRRHIASGG